MFTYGKRVRVSDDNLLSRKINGAVPTNDLDEFIKVTEVLFGVRAEVEESQITLKTIN
jgi:ferric-dicitrate binding protein FerR (iron transport regulator)